MHGTGPHTHVFAQVLPRACGDAGDNPIEDGMISSSSELLLGPKVRPLAVTTRPCSAVHLMLMAAPPLQETVFVPFTFLSLASGRVSQSTRRDMRRSASQSLANYVASHEIPMQERSLMVSISGTRSQQAVAMLKVHVHPRPFVIDRTIRFYHAEHEVLKRTIVMEAGGVWLAACGCSQPSPITRVSRLWVGASMHAGGGFHGAGGTWDGQYAEDELMGKYAYCTDDNVVCTSQAGKVRARVCWCVRCVVMVIHCGMLVYRAEAAKSNSAPAVATRWIGRVSTSCCTATSTTHCCTRCGASVYSRCCDTMCMR